MEIAKVFWSGRSQAVRLPKDFRFETAVVRIRRHGSGVILEPVPDNWQWLDALSNGLDDDFVGTVEAQPLPQERANLDQLFQ